MVRKSNVLMQLLGFNLVLLLCLFASVYWIKFIKSSVMEYSNIKSDAYDGTAYPIAFVPNWLKSKNTNKSIDFSSATLGVDEFIELPKYDTRLLDDASGQNKEAILARYTYPVVYMGNYKLDYQEYAWSHPGVDIRAPIWTPVLSIANWVVIKVKNTETWDGKYVVIRHDDVKNWGIIETLYSSYEHLNDIFVEEWSKISRGDVLWKVWMTWITTTPHLHFQIDKKVSPFHPYWPYTFQDAKNVSLDFFWAVDAWLGKENAIAFTIHPMEFIQNNLAKEPKMNSAPIIDTINASEQTPNPVVSLQDPPKTAESPVLAIETPAVNVADTTPVVPAPVIAPAPIALQPLPEWVVFRDIPKSSKLFWATKYLYDKSITRGFEDWEFKPWNTLTRQEWLIFVFKLYNIALDSQRSLPFNDIKSWAFIVPYLQKWIDLWLIARNKQFRPNDTISRAEFVTMLIKASNKILINSWNAWFIDVVSTDWYSPYIETFTSVFPSTGKWNKFEPNNVFNRGQIAQILYYFSKNK
ncbi:MAG: Lipoprotein [uncultured bacterium (gcode 4)]|uniref:Lipoprotein n=1 Tax=uncultured bacterium (gcode 4) TaxID=1234023 RepID=K2GC51_9BACT|nr:MAG: Lipoprotein [uncultured bacterium (gcode 4)]